MALSAHPQSACMKGSNAIQLLLTRDGAIKSRDYSVNLQSHSFLCPFAKYSNGEKRFAELGREESEIQLINSQQFRY